MLQDITHDIWEVFLRDELLLVAQLDNALSNTFRLLWRELKSKFFKVAKDVGFARVLAKRILPLSAETLGQKGILIKACLVVAISMNASNLRKHALAGNGFVWRNSNTAVTLHESRHLAQTTLVNMREDMKVVVQDGLYASKRRVSCSLTQAVDTCMDAPASCSNCGKHIADSQVVIIMGMEVEAARRIALHHLSHKAGKFHWIEDSECVGQHDAFYRHLAKLVHQSKNIVGTILHAVAPVLEIEIYGESFLTGIVYGLQDIVKMFLNGFVELFLTVFLRTFSKKIKDLTPTLCYPIYREIAVNEPEHFYPLEHTCLISIATYHLHGVLLVLRHSCRRHLYAVNVDVAQQHSRYHQFLVRQKRHAACLFAVA